MESSGSVGAAAVESTWKANQGDVGGQKAVMRTEVRGEVGLCLALALGPRLEDVSPDLLHPFFQFLCGI